MADARSSPFFRLWTIFFKYSDRARVSVHMGLGSISIFACMEPSASLCQTLKTLCFCTLKAWSASSACSTWFRKISASHLMESVWMNGTTS
eukprot:5276034-Pyramimonas_sp.AAC.1